MNINSLEGWLIVNNYSRYCRLEKGNLYVATDDKLENIEYSIQTSKIIDTVDVSDDEFDLLPENSPKLSLMSDNYDIINKWKNAFFDKNFEYINQSIPKMNDFILSKIIGEGYSGKVHLVRRKSDEKLFMKSKEKLSNATSIQRTITERNILIQNKFPFITKIYAAFQTENHLVFALEYVGGGNLQYHLDKGKNFTQMQIKIYLAELVLALEHLHQMGIVFRDLKPSNILIAKDGNLKLTDFGLSKYIIKTGKTKTLCGTHDYLSPEMVSGNSYGFSVDWWALGVIAFRLICGYLPFHNLNLSKLFEKIMACKYRFPNRIDPDSQDFISNLLKKDPNERLTVAQIKAHKYFSDIDWQKVQKKEYNLEFKPYRADDDSAFNFDLNLHDKCHCESYTDEYESSLAFSRSSSNSNLDLSYETDKSFIRDFSFSSTTEDFDDI